ncbi:PAS domain-containing protein [Streptomyces sp. NPDC051135]|uniref:PAS domain-containing protein n=1 Tax=unclassified Streptomyces TaxID=2593676 RepID=UPI0034425A96
MSSHLSADHPAAQPPGNGPVEALISQTRRLRGDVDAVRRGSRDDAADPRGRWQRALYDLALHQLTDLDAHLAQLRDGPAPSPRPGSLLSRVGSAEWNLLTDEAEWSGELFPILGRDPASAPLSLDELPSLVLTEDRPKLTAMVTDCLVDARPIDGEFRVVHPDGAVRTVHMMGEPVLDADGSTASMWAVLRDVSELRRSQRAVSETRDGLRHPPPPPWHALLRFPDEGRPGLDLAAAHLSPTAQRSPYGGWYDACPLADGDETLLTVGDLEAPGTEAHGPAVLIGALRGLALAGGPPARLRDRLTGLIGATALPPVRAALYCGYRPGTRTLSWAHTAGSAPLLFRGGTGHVLSGQDRTAAQDVSSTQDVSSAQDRPSGHTEAALEAGDLLLLHTGALEPEAVEHLLALAPDLTGAESAHRAMAIVTRELGELPGRRDACLLVARIMP